MFACTSAKTRKLSKYETWIPHKFQERAVEFILNRGSAALFLDPGLGKTSITLMAFDILRQEGIAKKMLVIAPLRVCQLVWRQEAKRWSEFCHLKFTLLHGNDKSKRLGDDSDIFLINPEGVKWLSTVFYKKDLPFDTIVIDELTKFKNAQSIRHKALMPFMPRVRRCWGLTGTPIPNGYMDLFGQMKILDGGKSLGFYFTHFRNKYFESDYSGFGYNLRRGAAREIEKAIAPAVIRMSAEDYLELPPLVSDIINVQMPLKARKIYEDMKRQMIANLPGGIVEASNAAAVYSKLKQMANGAVYSGDGILKPRKTLHIHDAKIEALLDLIEELSGTPLLVAYEFNHDLDRLKKALGKDTPHIGKGVSGKQAEKIERDWNAGKISVLLAHPASAGHGLNFQRGNANHVAHFSTTWNYEHYDQFIRRIRRQGNEAHTIFNHQFIMEDTIDNHTLNVIENKGLTQSDFFDALVSEIYHEGNSVVPPHGTQNEESEVVRKLKRRAKPIEEEYDEPENDVEEEEEETSKPRRRRRKSTAGTKRKLRGNVSDNDEDENDEDEDEPVSKRAKRRFSKKIRAAIDEDDNADEDEDEDEDEEPMPRKRRTRKKPAEAEETEVPQDGIDYDKLARAVLRAVGEALTKA